MGHLTTDERFKARTVERFQTRTALRGVRVEGSQVALVALERPPGQPSFYPKMAEIGVSHVLISMIVSAVS